MILTQQVVSVKYLNMFMIVALLVVVGGVSCYSQPISKKKLVSLNKSYRTKIWIAKKDIHPHFAAAGQTEVLFRKGSKVRIWMESKSDWVRVKAFDARESRENVKGKTIIYMFTDDVKQDLLDNRSEADKRLNQEPPSVDGTVILKKVSNKLSEMLEPAK